MTPLELNLKSMANALRGLCIDGVEAANSGHPGAPMGMADIATSLFANHLRFDAGDPNWPDRDRVIFSNGHASMLHYALLHLTGYEAMTLDQLKAFRQWGSLTPGHPESDHTPGIEVTTGPLGQGLGMSVGMAIAEACLRDEFGSSLCDHRTWVFAGDGCLMEGIGQEAASLAGHLGLGRINLLYDDNGITIDGKTNLSFTENTAQKFDALGWHVVRADGHDFVFIDNALRAASQTVDRPSIIICKTEIGFGSPKMAGSHKVHGAPLGPEEVVATKVNLGLSTQPFDVDREVQELWREVGKKGAKERANWQAKLDGSDPERKASLVDRQAGKLPQNLAASISTFKSDLLKNPVSAATRKSSQSALEMLTTALPAMIGGSADLTHSNLTQTSSTEEAFTRIAPGRYVNYGVREFAMGAAMNGIAQHGGFIPYGGTFLVFSDYMRNAIRLSALMGAQTIYVMTHDSIGLGEDGPTHQPVEHLASLRAVPGLDVIRPADSIETLEAWECSLNRVNRPTLLALSRQDVPQLQRSDDSENQTAKGAYVVLGASTNRDITILATGTEVCVAIEAAKLLLDEGIHAAVVSMPCWSYFEEQDHAYRSVVLGDAPRIAVEAATPFGWTRYVESESDVIGVVGFGASAPADRLYQEYGITVKNIAKKARSKLSALAQ